LQAQADQEVPFVIDRSILMLIGFFLPFGAGMQLAFDFDISKVFPLLSIVAIARAVQQKSFVTLPRAFWAFIAFAAIHTVIVYAVVFPDEFSIGILDTISLEGSFVRTTEGAGIATARFFLFALTSWAVSRLWSPRGGVILSIAWFAGLVTVVIIGGYRTVEFTFTAQETRLSAGFLDANAFGLSSLTCLSLLILNAQLPANSWFKIISKIAIPVCMVFMLMSGSRGSILGAFSIGIILMYGRFSIYSLIQSLAAIGIAMVILIQLFPHFADSVLQRILFQRLMQDHGAGRTDIWLDYLSHLKSFVLWGVGFQRSTTVINSDYNYGLAACHNTLLTILVEWGVLALVLFVSAISAIMRKARELPEELRRCHLAILVGWIVQSQFMDTLALRETWIIIGVCTAFGAMQVYSAPIPIFDAKVKLPKGLV
jgi:hypothetical protein